MSNDNFKIEFYQMSIPLKRKSQSKEFHYTNGINLSREGNQQNRVSHELHISNVNKIFDWKLYIELMMCSIFIEKISLMFHWYTFCTTSKSKAVNMHVNLYNILKLHENELNFECEPIFASTEIAYASGSIELIWMHTHKYTHVDSSIKSQSTKTRFDTGENKFLFVTLFVSVIKMKR